MSEHHKHHDATPKFGHHKHHHISDSEARRAAEGLALWVAPDTPIRDDGLVNPEYLRKHTEDGI